MLEIVQKVDQKFSTKTNIASMKIRKDVKQPDLGNH